MPATSVSPKATFKAFICTPPSNISPNYTIILFLKPFLGSGYRDSSDSCLLEDTPELFSSSDRINPVSFAADII